MEGENVIDDAANADGSEQIFVRQLEDGSLVTADGQRLVFSKDDITEIQFSAEGGESVMMPPESVETGETDEPTPSTSQNIQADVSADDEAVAETQDPHQLAENNPADSSIEDSIEEAVDEVQTPKNLQEKEEINPPRRSTRSRDSTSSRSVVEEIAAAFDDDEAEVAPPPASPRRGRPKKIDDSSADTDPEVLQIASPSRGRRKRVEEETAEEEDTIEEDVVSSPRPRGRPRRDDSAVKKASSKPAESATLESSTRKRSNLSTEQDKSPAATPKKQVRIMESPASVMSTPRTPASAIIPSHMSTPEQVYDFADEMATPSTSDRDNSIISATPDVGMNMSIETQTVPEEQPEHVEVTFWESSPGKRTVQTQTDPRLKIKKVKLENSLFDDDDSRRRRRRYETGDEFSLFEDSKKHYSKRANEEALKCPFCDKSFIGLVKHIKSRHSDEHDYDEEMRNARWRERIMKVSTGGVAPELPSDSCNDCGKVSTNMKRHRESHQMDRIQIPCPMCNKIVLKSGLSSHMRTVHSGRKPYKCPHCEYTSAFRGNLNTHVKGMHLHTRQYLCNVCHAAFKTLGALIGHTKRVHEGWKSPNQKIFICSVCEKRFTKKYHVDRHMLIHTGEKPHKCDDCQRTFNNKSNLMSHIQLVHKRLSPYQCDLCKETFKRKKLLLEHIGRVHVSRGEHIVFRTPMDEADGDDERNESMERGTVLQEVNQEALFADGNQVQLATVVSVEEAANLTEGQHYTTLQTETGEETIIIVHSGDMNDVAQVIMDQQDEQNMYVTHEQEAL